MANVKNTKQPAKQPPEDAMARVSALIAKAKKEGSIQATELTAELEKLDLPVEKIEQVYDTFDAMGIQIVSPELELISTTTSAWTWTTASAMRKRKS